MKTRLRNFGKLALMAAFCITAPLHAADTPLEESLPAFVQKSMDEMGLKSGMSIAVIKGDKTVYTGAFGYADIENNIAATPDTSFYIASSTKSLTGFAALMLADRGHLDLDKSLAAYFPEVSFRPEFKADQITIRHLLSHSHGLTNKPMVVATAYTGNHTPEKLVELLTHSETNAEAPLGSYEYGNEGYNIFSMIVERELNKPWQDVLAEEVFKPAGMAHTSAYMSDGAKPGWKVARPYGFANETPEKALYLTKKDNTMHAAGGVIATAPDLARFVQAQLSEGMIDGQQTFPTHLVIAAHTPFVSFEQKRGPYMRLGYGMGWITGTFIGERLISHFGGFAGASAHVSLMPDHDIGVVILANEGRNSQALSHILAGYIYDTLLEKEETEARRTKELMELKTKAEGFLKRVADARQKRKDTPWTLTKELSAYTGTFSNALYGSIEITLKADNSLHARYGNMRALLEPYNAPDSARVEFVPGSGKVITFSFDEQGTIQLKYDGVNFSRK